MRLYVAATYGSPGFNVAELSAHVPGEEGAIQHVIDVLPRPELLHNDDGRHDGSHGRWRLAYASFDILWLTSFIIAGVWGAGYHACSLCEQRYPTGPGK